MTTVPALRVQECNAAPVRADGDFVLYWMTAFRRTHWNFSLQRSVEWAQRLGKPLVIFEPLRVGYQWASDRLHRANAGADTRTSDGMHRTSARPRHSPVVMCDHATARAAGHRCTAMTHSDRLGLDRTGVNCGTVGRQRNSISRYRRHADQHQSNQDSRKKMFLHIRVQPQKETVAEHRV